MEICIIFLAILCFSFALYIATKYANQSLLDNYSFRQTQTALTAYWLGKNGFSLAYETPVAGQPWSIPFEFPIYQYIVALASQITNYSLDAVGRVVSFLFLILCLIPARSITRNLSISPLGFYIFAALLFSSPLYLYWGRTFMIETAALFFSVVAIKYFVDVIQATRPLKSSLFFLVFISLSILQKATTGLPVLAMLSIVYLFLHTKESASFKRFFFDKKIILALVYFGIPLVIGIIWTTYTDQIKLSNGLGANLTSSALTKWNWGTLSQRLSFDLYGGVIWERIFVRNLSGTLGAAILMIGLLSGTRNPIKSAVLVSALMGLAPAFLFTNLHIIHDYYPAGNLIFIIYATAVSLGHIINNYFKKGIITFSLLAIMVISNYLWFSKEYFNVVKTEFNQENSRDYAVSEILKREIPPEKYFVAFGNDWSSSFAYLSGRKSFTVPGFFNKYQEISTNPERFIEEVNLGAVVVCASVENPTINDLSRWATANRKWKIGEVHGCYIAVPEIAPSKIDKDISPAECQGNIDFLGERQVGKQKSYVVAGWSLISGENSALPEKTYVTLTKMNSDPIYLEALQIHPPSARISSAPPNNADSVFSRVINTELYSGQYDVGVAILNNGKLRSCQFHKRVFINHGNIN